jgi:cbb3-type cytochrome oxidase subunit 1
MQVEKFYYDNKIVRNFAFATIIWGTIGMLMGVWVALLMVFPQLNFSGIAVGQRNHWSQLWPAKTFTYQCSDLCFCWQWYLHGLLLFSAKAA